MWFVLSLLSGLLFAANRLIVRSALTKNVNPLAFGAVHELIAGVLLLPIAHLNFKLPQTNEVWIALILSVFFIFLADLFSVLSLRDTEASLFQIVGQLRHGVVLIGAYILFSEAITLSKIISILLITLGVGLALMEKSKIKITRGVMYAFLSTISIGFGFLFIKQTLVEIHPAVSGSFSFIIAGLLMYILLIARGGHKTRVKFGSRQQLFAAGAIFAVFELVLFTALALGEASRVTPVTQSSMVFTLIGGYLFLGEKTRLKQKIIGSTLITAGIVLLYFI